MNIKYNWLITLLLGLILFPSFILAQEATIRGFVYEEENGEPAMFSNIFLEGTTFGASSDVNGYFLINKIPAGNYNLKVTYLGFDTISVPILLVADKMMNKKFYLKRSILFCNFLVFFY